MATSVVSVSPAVANSDTPTNLGAVAIDCDDDGLENFTIGFTGGAGDYFILTNTGFARSCSVPDNTVANPAPTDGPITVGPRSAQVFLVQSEGSFTVSGGNQTVTATVIAHPIFANQTNVASGTETIDFSCANVSRYAGRVVFFVDDDLSDGNKFTFSIRNSGSAPECTVKDPNNVITSAGEAGDGSSTIAPGATRSFDIDAVGSFTIEPTDVGVVPVTITLVRSVNNQFPSRGDVDLGVNAVVGSSVTYNEVYHTGGKTYSARVVVDQVVNLDGNRIDELDENLNVGEPNWNLAPAIDVANNATKNGFATFAVEFQESSVFDPNAALAPLSGVSVTVIDIDGLQYIEVDASALSQPPQLSTSPPTKLTATQTGSVWRVSEQNNVGSSDDDQDHWVVLNLASVSQVSFTVGMADDGGASFGLLFRPLAFDAAPAVAQNTSSTSNQEAPTDPAIHLNLNAAVGTSVSDSSVLIEGQALQVGSAYSLVLRPSGPSLFSGTVNRSGGFTHTVPLPSGLTPGTYTLELRATASDGSVLVLTQTFSVGPGGVITSVNASSPAPALAATGGNGGSIFIATSLLLLLMGLTSLAYARRRTAHQ